MAGLEPATAGFVDRCSIQLSYMPRVVGDESRREYIAPEPGLPGTAPGGIGQGVGAGPSLLRTTSSIHAPFE